MSATCCETLVLGHHVLDLLGARGGRGTVALLRADAENMFGPHATYANTLGAEFDFDGLLNFLVAAGKLSRRGDQLALVSDASGLHR